MQRRVVVIWWTARIGVGATGEQDSHRCQVPRPDGKSQWRETTGRTVDACARLKQALCDTPVSFLCGIVQSSVATTSFVTAIGIRTSKKQMGDHSLVAGKGCEVQRRQPARPLAFHGEACIEKKGDDMSIPLEDGKRQGGVAFPIVQEEVDLRVEQESNDGRVATNRSVVQGRIATAVRLVDGDPPTAEFSFETGDSAELCGPM